jgi:nitrite reductase/ring-hydroxylating ferredoxin subunit
MMRPGTRPLGEVPAVECESRAMTDADRIPAREVPPGSVRRVGDWAVGNRDGELFAVSRRCRHQLADLAEGSIDEDGCLVCPWHQSRYDVTTGAMVEGPRGLLGYHGPSPGYTQLVRTYGRLLRLKVGRAFRSGDDVVVG